MPADATATVENYVAEALGAAAERLTATVYRASSFGSGNT